MFSKSVALAVLMASQNNVSAQEQSSLRATTPRHLSFESIAGYGPRSQVTDHNAIDLDQKVIEQHLADKTDDSFAVAKTIYEEGAHSKSFAQVTLTTPLDSGISKGATIEGVNAEGEQVIGKATDDFPKDSTEVRIQYQTSDVQDNYVKCQVGALGGRERANTVGCFAAEGTLKIEGDTYPYEYNVNQNNKNARDIQGFSTGAKEKMYTCANCPYVDYEKFYDYYGEFDYANKWVLAALEGKATNFDNGNANFASFGFPGRVEAVKKGTAYMNVWMYVIREFEDALDDCKKGCILCNDDPVHAWDEGVAFYTGSLEKQDGSGDGKLMYALADKRCTNYKTCGVQGTELDGTSKVNYDLLGLFALGQQNLLVGNCKEARVNKERIAELMTVPLVQGTIRYAYFTDRQASGSGEKEAAEGAVFAAAVLPVVHHCNADDARTIYNNMAVGSGKTDFLAVKRAFERNYECMGITCADVGGLWDGTKDTYFQDANPCKDSSTSSSSNNGLAIGLGVTTGLAVLTGLVAVMFLRKRERSGNPVFSPAKEVNGISS